MDRMDLKEKSIYWMGFNYVSEYLIEVWEDLEALLLGNVWKNVSSAQWIKYCEISVNIMS